MGGERVGLGLIGCGSFGLFCLEAFSRMEEVRLVAAARASKPAAREGCRRLGVRTYDAYDDVIRHPQVDLVHVATPPDSHPRLVTAALAAGKHVLCEKPPALDSAAAARMVAAARNANCLLATNFVLRYSPLAQALGRLLGSGSLGQPLAAWLVNSGSDSGLGDEHWFWNKSISGGIFIEHGVHFFDLYASWLGPGRVVAACTASRRADGGIEDRVACTVRHDNGAIVNHYHGFDQIAPMDRTSHRILCEMGEIRLHGWVPLSLTADAAVDEAGARRLADCCGGADAPVVETFAPSDQPFRGRGRTHRVDRRVRIRYECGDDKQAAYADCLRALLRDQLARLADPAHEGRVTEADGPAALTYAEAAVQLADAGKEST